MSAEWMDYPIDCQKFADLAGVAFDVTKVTSLPIRYCKTDWMERNQAELQKGSPCILITSSSDASVDSEMLSKLPKNVVCWYSTNVVVGDTRLISIPIGFVFHPGRTRVLIEQAKKGPQQPANLMYMNFSRHCPSLKGKREGLYEFFGGNTWVTTKGGNSFDDVSPEQFYFDLATHPFTLSPPGAGPDCHRHWEAMALGSIPIVLRSPATKILDDLPCLQVDSWVEVTRERLRKEIVLLKQRFDSPAMRKLSMKYWQEKIGVLI